MAYHYRYYYDDNQRVIAVSSYAGRRVRGVAKCSPEDTFDPDKGLELAKARCDVKIAKKRTLRAAECYEDAMTALRKAEDRVYKMQNYLLDSEKAYEKAMDHLTEIEKNM